jgi:flagellar hook-length control protein FliK
VLRESAAAPAQPAPLARVQSAQIAEAIHAAVAFVRRGSASVARIALQPRELGDVRVHLAQTSQGLVARLTASTTEGAQALLQARAELHSSLSQLGTTLLRLDVGAQQQQQQRSAGERATASALGDARRGEPAGEETNERSAATVAGSDGQAKGVQVDVLA